MMKIYEKIHALMPSIDQKELEIIEILKKIPDEYIANKEKEVYIEDDLIHIDLFCDSNKRFNIKMIIGLNKDKYKIYFFVGDIYILDHDDFSDDNDRLFYINEIESILKSNIEVHEYLVGTKLYQTKLFCDKYLEDDGSLTDIGSIEKILWPWKKKKVKIKKKFFKPWIPEDKT